jgi:hypothetical protein
LQSSQQFTPLSREALQCRTTTHKPPTPDAMAHTTNTTTTNIPKATAHNHAHPSATSIIHHTTRHQQQPPHQHDQYDRHNHDDLSFSSTASWRRLLAVHTSECYGRGFGAIESIVEAGLDKP